MTTRPNRRRRRTITVGLATAAAAASAFLAWGPALAATEPPSPASASAPGSAAHVPAITDPAVSGTDLVAWDLPVQIQIQRENMTYTSISNVSKTRHDTAKNTIQNVR